MKVEKKTTCFVCLTPFVDSRHDDGFVMGLLIAGKQDSPFTYSKLYADACTRHRRLLTYWNGIIDKGK